MKKPRLVLADQAVADVIEQADWYAAQSGRNLETRWEQAITSALLRLVRNAKVGALCNFRNGELRNVRRAAIHGFSKHLIFYKIDENEIFILLVLHGARDLENFL